jgi:chromosome segregation ATPase
MEEPLRRMPEPAEDDVEALRAKVAEQAHVIALAKTRVETLLEEKREAYEREQALQQRILSLEAELTQTLGAAASTEVPTLAGLAARVAALEAAVAGR